MDKLVTIEVYRFVSEADLMQSALEQAGIRAYLADDNLIAMDWLLMNAVGGVKLQVAAEDETQARAILQRVAAARRAREGEGEIVFECENCHRQICFPAARCGGVETCKYCGGYVDVPEA